MRGVDLGRPRVRNQELERYEHQQVLAAGELQALTMQLHPHFLFNTLNGISTLIDNDQTTAKAMVVKLSSLLRTALEYGSSDLISLQEELQFVEKYLDLEKMRLGPRLAMTWLIDPDARQIQVPQMILQPLVENAIRHGIACSRVGGWVEIVAQRNGGEVELQVRNSVRGKGSAGTGIGLRNTEARLKYLYSDRASLSFAIADDQTATATILLPALGSSSDRTVTRTGKSTAYGGTKERASILVRARILEHSPPAIFRRAKQKRQ